VAYQYDVLGRRTQMTANGQQPTTYQYDAASRLTRVAQGTLFAQLGYDHANRRKSLGYSNGTSSSYAYDLASRLTGITHNGPSGVIEALTYTYDAAGNRVSLTRANDTASLLPTAVPSASYDAANDQTTFAGAALTYDANGNLTNDGTNTYQWDSRNRLTGISGGMSASFGYDPLGRRISKTINGANQQFAYNGNDIAAEIGGGAVGAYYLRSLSFDEPFVRQTSTGNEFYHTDALGSSLALSNDHGASATTYGYEPYGKTTVTGTSVNGFQYTGRENDGIGLYYYRARYYHSRLQRFIKEDPIGFAGGINLYSYVLANPLRFIDPFGLEQFEVCTHAGGCGMQINIPPSKDPEHVRNSIREKWPPTSPMDDALDEAGRRIKKGVGDALEDEAVKAARRALAELILYCIRTPGACIKLPQPDDADAAVPTPSVPTKSPDASKKSPSKTPLGKRK
jgi:RHS repeat-associated protein